ncbi:hypothetical protein [Kamptonema sp. UHCC 0994]|uniref:hypothetical protein n=1 Tax=Kamptonema sp. UHCC 0994 TaxID=3031329 RepID=UPI0023B894F8|nr:hypothetical protein [Kamptonema sp. UHCC 0994]MDF0554954.1 hypothetical protein [Kamptonema sp. UHCC 0994]
MKSTSTFVAFLGLLILGLESNLGLSLAAVNHTNGQKNQTEKIIVNTNVVPECKHNDGKYPCTN